MGHEEFALGVTVVDEVLVLLLVSDQHFVGYLDSLHFVHQNWIGFHVLTPLSRVLVYLNLLQVLLVESGFLYDIGIIMCAFIVVLNDIQGQFLPFH